MPGRASCLPGDSVVKSAGLSGQFKPGRGTSLGKRESNTFVCFQVKARGKFTENTRQCLHLPSSSSPNARATGLLRCPRYPQEPRGKMTASWGGKKIHPTLCFTGRKWRGSGLALAVTALLLGSWFSLKIFSLPRLHGSSLQERGCQKSPNSKQSGMLYFSRQLKKGIYLTKISTKKSQRVN